MKVKKLLIGLLVSGLALSFAGCGGDEVINDSGEKVSSYGQFIEIKRNHYTDSNTNATDQIFMYDKDTKIVYVSGANYKAVFDVSVNYNGTVETETKTAYKVC